MAGNQPQDGLGERDGMPGLSSGYRAPQVSQNPKATGSVSGFDLPPRLKIQLWAPRFRLERASPIIRYCSRRDVMNRFHSACLLAIVVVQVLAMRL